MTAAWTAQLSGQGGSPGYDTRQTTASRSELELLAARAEQSSQTAIDAPTRDRKRIEAASIRERLREGDFQVGDRIVLSVENDSSLNDTLVVRAGRYLSLPNLTEVSLHGVLRSELHARLTNEIGRYIREPRVEATALIRLAVVGQVMRPGYYAVHSDALLTDVIMYASGPSANANLDDIIVRRDSRVVWDANEVRLLVSNGMTLDQASLRAGDEIFVAERRRRSIGPFVSIISALGTLTLGILAASR
jgi:protein involved in polysaccharide export with SLBB domain